MDPTETGLDTNFTLVKTKLTELNEQLQQTQQVLNDLSLEKDKLMEIVEHIFMSSTYAELNNDLKHLKESELLDHFIKNGFREGRKCGKNEMIKFLQKSFSYSNTKLLQFLLREGRYILTSKYREENLGLGHEGIGDNRQLSKTLGSRINLNKNSDFLMSLNHTLYDTKTSTLATFIPKNGCTNLRYSFALSNGYIKGSEDLDWIHSNNGTMRASKEDIKKSSYTFVILRNIFDRIVSTFWNKIIFEIKNKPSNDQSHIAIIKLLKADDEESFTFKQFVDRLWNNPLILQQDYHLRPQIDFLTLENYDNYFTVNEFEVMQKVVESKSHLKIYDTRSFTVHTTYNYQSIEDNHYYGLTPVKELRKLKDKKLVPTYNDFYDNEDAFKIASLYISDILLYCSKTGKYDDLEPLLQKALIYSPRFFNE